MPAQKTIGLGSKGSTVKFAQERLEGKGYDIGSGPDGDFGVITERAVKQFQSAHALKADGVVGDKTWDALLSTGQAKVPDDVLGEQAEWLMELLLVDIDLVDEEYRGGVYKVVESAINDLGSKESPDGSNAGPEINHLVERYNQIWWVLKQGVDIKKVKKRGYPTKSELAPAPAWCGMAVSNWIRDGLGLDDWEYKLYKSPLKGHPFEHFLGGPGPIEDWADKAGVLKWQARTPRRGDPKVLPGDIFTMGRGGSGSDPHEAVGTGHVGMVVADDPSDAAYVITIEGNIGNAVGSRRRLKADLRWFVRWYK